MTQDPPVIDRVSPNDLMQRALDVGPSPMHVGAVLVLDTAPDLPRVRATIGARIGALERLRQRQVRTPPGCGRPVWVDTVVDLDRHVQSVVCPAPGDREALLATAVRHYVTPLPTDRPGWRAVLITGLAGGGSALLFVVHHAVTDGVGGMAVLGALADGAPSPADRPVPRLVPRPAPSRRALAWDAWAGRARSLGRARQAARAVRPAAAELGGGRPRAARCSLLGRLGPELTIGVCQVPLAPLLAATRARGATVNDAVLAAVVRALGTVLDGRGEQVDRLVVSVPVTSRDPADAATNRVGVMPVELPTRGAMADLLAAVAAVTGLRKGAGRGSSTALSRPAFRALAALGLLRPMVRRQRLVNTFVSNVRGPHRAAGLRGHHSGRRAAARHRQRQRERGVHGAVLRGRADHRRRCRPGRLPGAR